MEWSERMNLAIDYIEKNLDGEIDINEAAIIARCSSYHFQRMFFAVIGITVSDYARRRRLTLAASEIASSDIQVIDVALKYGYDSPNAFTRAFRNVHGINPRAARTRGVKLIAFPRVSFHIELKGGNNMEYKIIEKPAFDIVGKSRKIKPSYGQQNPEVDQFWKEYSASKDYQTLCEMTLEERELITGAHIILSYMPSDKKTWNSVLMGEPLLMVICIEKSAKMDTSKFEVFHIPAAAWAVFDILDYAPEKVYALNKRIWSEWFPSAGYEHDHDRVPEIEAYFPAGIGKPPYRCQLWYPVIKKN